MKKLYAYTLAAIAAASLSICSASAQTLPSLAGATQDTGVHLDKWVEKVSDGNYKLTLATYATGGSVTTRKEVATPLDIVLVLDLSGSMSNSYTSVTTSYTARSSQSYTYSGYGSNTYYYKHTDGEYYPVSRTTYTGSASYNALTSTTYSYDSYVSNAYWYKNGNNYCLVTRGCESNGSNSYTKVNGSYSYSNFPDNTYYYKDGNSYYLVKKGTYTQGEGWGKKTYYCLTYTKDKKTYYLKSNGKDDKQYGQTNAIYTIYTGDLYTKTSNYYYLTFTDGGTTYYLASDGSISTTRPSVTSSSGTLYRGVLYSNDAPTYYCLSYIADGEVHYLDASGTTTVETGVSGTGTSIYSGVLYEKKTTSSSMTRLAALKAAVEAFVNTVKDNAVKDTVNHRISIVKFGTYLEPKVGNLYWADETWGKQNQTQVVTDLQSVKDYGSSIIQTVNNFTAGGSTPSDWGLMLADCVLKGKIEYTDYKNNTISYPKSYNGYNADGSYKTGNGTIAVSGDVLARSDANDVNVKDGAKKLVVFFTDGQPYMDQNDGKGNVTTVTYRNVKDYAVAEAKKLKDSGADVYAVAVVDDADEKFTDNTSTSGKYTINQFMNYVSSNYPSATSMANPGTQNSADYYKLADGDLTDIFVSIAQEATSGGAKRSLGAETTASIDYLTDDFEFPAGTDPDDIELFVDDCIGYDAKTKKYIFDTTGTRRTLAEFNGTPDEPNSTYVTVDEATKKVAVKGYFYTRADDNTTSPVTYGNWVGPRTTKSGGSTTTVYKGRRLVYTIPIIPSADCEGGYDLPTNTGESGLYVIEDNETTAIDKYPIPDLDFPSIAIIKYGMKKGESASFTVQRIKDVKGDDVSGSAKFKITLTGTGADTPAYAILRDVEEGTYKVVETSWSWSYDLVEVTKKDAAGTVTMQNPSEPVVENVLSRNLIGDWPEGINETCKCVLFIFKNEKNQDDGSIYAESVVKNKFKRGKQTTTSSVTTNSK